MISFFRKIRKKMADDNPPDGRAGKPMKYMRYAIGFDIISNDSLRERYQTLYRFNYK